MTERPEDKSNDCGRAICDLERYSWHELLDTLQVHDSFKHQGGPRLSWNNGQFGLARRMARLDRLYTPNCMRGNLRHMEYFIHRYPVGSDHSPVQVGLCLGQEVIRKSSYKWNVSHLKGEIASQLKHMWATLPQGMTFFSKLRKVARFYRFLNMQKAKEFRKEELGLRARLECAIASLHEDVHNVGKQGKVMELQNALEEVESRKARGATIRSRVKWNKVGNKCSVEFFKSVKQKNSSSVIMELQDNHGRVFTNRADLDHICHSFYAKLYKRKTINEEALREVFVGFTPSFNEAMNDTLT